MADSTGDGFGQNDTRIDGDASPKLVAAIASITIKGTASGSTSSVEFYGITAERIGKAKIGGTNLALTKGADEFAIDPTNNNFRLVDFA